MLPQIIKNSQTYHMLIDGKRKVLLSGELHNSSSSSEDYMRNVWPKLADLGMNCVVATASWELIEPRKGTYSFETLDHLIYSARKYGMKIVLIWFGIWKGGSSCYAPGYIKKDTDKYFRGIDRNGRKLDMVSPFCDQAINADARAFAEMMKHLRLIDEKEQTVVMIQVENEVGFYGDTMDRLPVSEEQFAGNVPDDLMSYLDKAELTGRLGKAFSPEGHTWRGVFGDVAEESFMAYMFARALGRIAAAGKKEYPLPMYANVWPVQYPNEDVRMRPSGGPSDCMIPIWQWAGKPLDAVGTDLYLLNYESECEEYKCCGTNPLILPELRYDRWAPGMILYGVSQGALLVAPFAIETLNDLPEPPTKMTSVFAMMSGPDPSRMISRLYREIDGMQDILADAKESDNIRTVMQTELVFGGFTLGSYHFRVVYHNILSAGMIPACVTVIRRAENEFTVIGFGADVEIYPLEVKQVDFLSIKEVSYENGKLKVFRYLNGDEGRITLSDTDVCVRNMELYTY